MSTVAGNSVFNPAVNPLVPLAELVARTRFEDLSPHAVAAAKTFILDTLGVGVAGSTGPRVTELIATLASWGERADATVWVDGRKLPAVQAAIANAYQIHSLEWDCVHEPAVVHPMATLFSALLVILGLEIPNDNQWERASPVVLPIFL